MIALLLYLLWDLFNWIQRWFENRKIRKKIQKIKKIINRTEKHKANIKEDRPKRDSTKEKRKPRPRLPSSISLFDSSSIKLFKLGLDLKNFTREEIIKTVNLPRMKILHYLEILVSLGIVEEINYGKDQTRNFYLLKQEKIKNVCERLLALVEKNEREEGIVEKPKEIPLMKTKIKSLLEKGGKGLYFIGFNDQVGPVLKYKVLGSDFPSRMEKEPGDLAKIVTTLSLDVKELTLFNNIELLCKKIEKTGEGHPYFILIEKTNTGKEKHLLRLLRQLGEHLEEKKLTKENIKTVLSSIL